ncbi:flippase [Thermodesulfobacteriota bacterium]
MRGASMALILKVAGASLSFALNVALARLLGSHDTGLFYLALSCITIATVIGRMGIDNSYLRYISAGASIKDWTKVKGVYLKGLSLSLIVSSATTLVIIIIAPWLANSIFSEPQLIILIRWMAIAIIPFTVFTLHAHALQAIKRIFDYILVLNVLVPLFSLMGILILVSKWDILGAVWAYSLATYLTAIIAIWLWRRHTLHLKNAIGYFNTTQLLRSSLPLFWISMFQLVITWSPNFMLGIYSTIKDVGIFSIANRTSMLTSFILIAVNSVVAPKFAAIYHQGDIKKLGLTARKSAKLMFFFSAPILFFFIFLPDLVMNIFGDQFSEGSVVLTILAIGQFVNVMTGPVGYILLMCGCEVVFRNIMALSAFLILIFNAILIPHYGAIGAAMATAVVISLQNLFALVMVKWKFGIVVLPIFKEKNDVK